jgi:hypothetical protein
VNGVIESKATTKVILNSSLHIKSCMYRYSSRKYFPDDCLRHFSTTGHADLLERQFGRPALTC